MSAPRETNAPLLLFLVVSNGNASGPFIDLALASLALCFLHAMRLDPMPFK